MLGKFGAHTQLSDKPLKQFEDEGVQEALEAIELVDFSMGVSCVGKGAFELSDGSTVHEIWQPVIRVEQLPYIIGFGPVTDKETALRYCISKGKSMGGSLIPTVPGGDA